MTRTSLIARKNAPPPIEDLPSSYRPRRGRSCRLSRKAARPEGAGCGEESEAGTAVGQDWIPEARVERSTTPWAVGQTASIQSLSLTNLLPAPGTDT